MFNQKARLDFKTNSRQEIMSGQLFEMIDEMYSEFADFKADNTIGIYRSSSDGNSITIEAFADDQKTMIFWAKVTIL